MQNTREDEFKSEMGSALFSWGQTMRLLEQCLRIVFTNQFASVHATQIFLSTLTEKQKIHIFHMVIKRKNRPKFCFLNTDSVRNIKDHLKDAVRACNFIIHSFLALSPNQNLYLRYPWRPNKTSAAFNLGNLELLKEKHQTIKTAAAILLDFIARAENARNPAAATQDSLFDNAPPMMPK